MLHADDQPCDIDDIAHILDAMRCLECAATALAAAEVTPAQLDRAREINRELRRHVHDSGAAAGRARWFHQFLLAACPNVRMLELLAQHVVFADARTPALVDESEIARVADEHDEIARLIGAGAAPRELEHVLRQHARTSPLCSVGT